MLYKATSFECLVLDRVPDLSAEYWTGYLISVPSFGQGTTFECRVLDRQPVLSAEFWITITRILKKKLKIRLKMKN